MRYKLTTGLQAPVLVSQQKVYAKAPVPTQAQLLLVRLQLLLETGSGFATVVAASMAVLHALRS